MVLPLPQKSPYKTKFVVIYGCVDETCHGVLTFLVKNGILLAMNVVMAITK